MYRDIVYVNPDTAAERALHYVEQGFTAVKFDPAGTYTVYDGGMPTLEELIAFLPEHEKFRDPTPPSVPMPAPQTAPSHASLFTSEYPGVHRIINVHGPHPQLFTLPEGLRTLAEELDEAGYDTGAFVSGGNLTGRMGMDRGFDVWDERYADVSDRDALTRRRDIALAQGR